MNRKIKDIIIEGDACVRGPVKVGMGAVMLDGNGTPWILSQVGPSKFCFISLRDGNRLSENVMLNRAGCHNSFSTEEIRTISGGCRIEEWTIVRPGASWSKDLGGKVQEVFSV